MKKRRQTISPDAQERKDAGGSGLGVQVIARAASILRALESQEDGLSLGQLAARVDLPRSTVQRIVAALDQENFVIAASLTSGVRLGPALVQIARSTRFYLAEFVRPYIENLSRETGETVDVAVLNGSKAVFVDQVQGSHRLRAVSAIGVSFPLHCTANGKALLASLDQTSLLRLKPQLHGNGDGPAAQRGWSKLMAELARIRESGIAFDREEHSDGICAIGTAISGVPGGLAAISIPVPSMRFSKSEPALVAALKNCRAALQRAL